MEKLKKVEFLTHKEDIRRLVIVMLEQITNRNKRKRSKIITRLNETLSKQYFNSKSIVKELEELTKSSSDEAIQFQAILPLLGLLDEEYIDLPTDTEVFEDSSDLVEDSLRIHSGTIEPISVPTDTI